MNKFSKKIKYYFPLISALFTVFLFVMMTLGAMGEEGYDSDVLSVFLIILVIILVIVLIVSYSDELKILLSSKSFVKSSRKFIVSYT